MSKATDEKLSYTYIGVVFIGVCILKHFENRGSYLGVKSFVSNSCYRLFPASSVASPLATAQCHNGDCERDLAPGPADAWGCATSHHLAEPDALIGLSMGSQSKPSTWHRAVDIGRTMAMLEDPHGAKRMDHNSSQLWRQKR